MKKTSTKPELKTDDIFTNTYNDYSKTGMAKRLNEKFRIKPFYEKFKELKITTVILSYLFNVVSALGASSLVYLFIRQFVAARLGEVGSFTLATLITLTFIILLEIKKRKTVSRFYIDLYQLKKINFGLATIMVLIYGISVSFTYFGAKWAIVELTPEPELINKDSMIMGLEEKIATNLTSITKHRANTIIDTNGKKVIRWNSEKAITTLEEKGLLLENRLISIQEAQENGNGVIIVEHKAMTKLTAGSAAWVTVGCEILFLLCMKFSEFYDYRSHNEMVALGLHLEGQSSTGSVPVQVVSKPSAVSETGVKGSETGRFTLEPSQTEQIIETMQQIIEQETDQSTKTALKAFRKKVQEYNWKLNNPGNGKNETSYKNIKRYINDFEEAGNLQLIEINEKGVRLLT